MNSKFNPDNVDQNGIAKYLLENPGFFSKFPEVLDKIQSHKTAKDKVISLGQNQLFQLRREKGFLKENLLALLEIATQNDRLGESIHKVTIEIIKASDLKRLLEIFASCLKVEFHVADSVIKILNFKKSDNYDSRAADQEIELVLGNLDSPICTKTPITISNKWFKEIHTLKSFLYCPIIGSSKLGILVLASTEEEHYNEDLDFVFLKRLVEVFALRLEGLKLN